MSDDKLRGVQGKAEAARLQLADNIQHALVRSERLDNLSSQSQQLSDDSVRYWETVKAAHDRLWWKKTKAIALIVGGIVLLLVIIIVPAALSRS